MRPAALNSHGHIDYNITKPITEALNSDNHVQSIQLIHTMMVHIVPALGTLAIIVYGIKYPPIPSLQSCFNFVRHGDQPPPLTMAY